MGSPFIIRLRIIFIVSFRYPTMKSHKIFPLLAATLSVTGCVPVIAAGVGGAVGIASVQEGGISEAASDLAIQAEINDLWFRHDTTMFSKLDLTINQGRVLITGVVQNPQHRVDAVRLAWQAKGVVQVINEIKVANSEGFVGYAKDTWITTRLRSAILVDTSISSLNYSIDTVQGTVYLMGFANNQAELDRVIQKARTIANVKQVVSYVKMVGQPYETGAGSGGAGEDYAQPVGGLSSSDMGGSPPAAVEEPQPIDMNQNSLYD
jgi:osmotically-inducible protein OsmY